MACPIQLTAYSCLISLVLRDPHPPYPALLSLTRVPWLYVSSIQYLLCFDDIAPPRTSPKKRPKSVQPPGRVPEATFDILGRPFARLGRFLVDLVTP